VAAVAVLAAGLLAGCGNSRTPIPDLDRAAQPSSFRTLTLGAAGVSLSTPRNWTVTSQSAPLVITLNSGPAVIALWRLPRTAPPPAGSAALAAAGRSLLAAVRRRAPDIPGLRATATRVDGVRAITVDAIERIAGRLRRVTSTHVYVRGAELVLDEYAPPTQFRAVARAVFVPVLRSLRLTAALS
jgi:hypothetical protein